MHYNKRITLLIWLMTCISLIISGFSVFSLYRTAVEEIKMRLVETTQSQARFIETIAEFDAAHRMSDEPEGSHGATLSIISAAHNKYEQSGSTTEFSIAERQGDWIKFLIRHRHGGLEDYLKPIEFDSDHAVPMQQALLGNSGTIIAEDYRGEMVVAAYEPVGLLNYGIVAKIDLSEIRSPFIRAGLYSSLFAILVIGLGATLFVRISNPLIDKINQQNNELLQSNQRLMQEIKERLKFQDELEKAHQELEIKVNTRTGELSTANEMLKKEMQIRKEAEQELRRNETMLKRIFDGILDPLILLDKQMTIMMMNRAAVNYYRIENPQDVVGKICHLELADKAEICQGCDVMRAIAFNQQITYERKGIMNPELIEKVVAYPIAGDNGSVTSTIVRISDITDKKLVERQLIQKEKLASLGIMVSSIAHEINNPNNFISFNIPILRDYIEVMLPIIAAYASDKHDFELCSLPYRDFEEDIFKLITNIENGSKRINSFIYNLRGYIQDKSDTSRIPVKLEYAIDSVLSICHSKVNQSAKSFFKNIPDDLPDLYAHPYAIEQILINFLINACQALDNDDSWIKLDVTVDDQGKQIKIMVSDNGHGMDDKTLSKIFDPFYSTKSPESGTGLGLFVSHRLAERMGGSIDVKSRPGEGSQFTLLLPVRGPHREAGIEMKESA